MFFSSVLVPSSRVADRADGDVGVAAQRALLHVHVADAEPAQRRAQQPQPLAGLLGRAHVGLGDDLHQRRAAAVEVDDRGLGAVDAPAGARVHELGRVLLEVHAMDAHVAQPPAPAQGLVVLGDLVVLGVVGIEVVLAVEDRPRGQLAVQREPDEQAVVDRLGVGHRQRARQPQAHLAGVRVGRLAEGQRAAAEHLRPRAELDVDLQADDGLVVGHALPAPGRGVVEADRLLERVGGVEEAILAEGRARRAESPTGSPSLRPHGIEIAGIPASGIGTVK